MKFEPGTRIPNAVVGRLGKWFIFDQNNKLVINDGSIPQAKDWSEGLSETHFLGTATVDGEDVPVWAARCTSELKIPANSMLVGLREAFAILEEFDWIMAGRASQILAWARDHAFCGRCGVPTVAVPDERAVRCPDCGLMAFPRLTPAVIMLVERADGKALLAWGRQFPGRFFSSLAGFVEPGESLEQAVAREVREEVGVEVEQVRYFGSQPWPFPNSLMIAFNAQYAGGEFKLQESEIVEAGWFGIDELPPVPRGRMSIAGWLIEDWIERRTEP